MLITSSLSALEPWRSPLAPPPPPPRTTWAIAPDEAEAAEAAERRVPSLGRPGALAIGQSSRSPALRLQPKQPAEPPPIWLTPGDGGEHRPRPPRAPRGRPSDDHFSMEAEEIAAAELYESEEEASWWDDRGGKAQKKERRHRGKFKRAGRAARIHQGRGPAGERPPDPPPPPPAPIGARAL